MLPRRSARLRSPAPVLPRPSASTRRRTFRPRGRWARGREQRRARGADPHAGVPGSKAKRIFEYVGTNSRLDEIRRRRSGSSCGSSTRWTALRREAAERYRELGLGMRVDVPVDEPGHVYHLFVSRSPHRDEIRAALTEAQHRQRRLLRASSPPPAGVAVPRLLGGRPPETERAAKENFSVPLWAGITVEQQERVVATVLAATEARVA